jgi:ribonuclease VapC
VFIDASVIVAILNREPERAAGIEMLNNARTDFYYSAMTLFEASIAIARTRHSPTKVQPKPSAQDFQEAERLVMDFLSALGAKDIPVTQSVGQLAVTAAATYGRQVGHKAQLNLGDCFTYACAHSYRLKIAYIGNDFSETDLG